MTFQASLPKVYVGPHDYERLRQAAAPLSSVGSSAADFLLSELERSVPCSTQDLPEDAVAMGRCVAYRLEDSKEEESGVLVFPDEYAPHSGKVSVLSPLGAALFGLRPGSSILYRSATGTIRTVTVLSVSAAPVSNVIVFRPRAVPPSPPPSDPDGPDAAA